MCHPCAKSFPSMRHTADLTKFLFHNSLHYLLRVLGLQAFLAAKLAHPAFRNYKRCGQVFGQKSALEAKCRRAPLGLPAARVLRQNVALAVLKVRQRISLAAKCGTGGPKGPPADQFGRKVWHWRDRDKNPMRRGALNSCAEQECSESSGIFLIFAIRLRTHVRTRLNT